MRNLKYLKVLIALILIMAGSILLRGEKPASAVVVLSNFPPTGETILTSIDLNFNKAVIAQVPAGGNYAVNSLTARLQIESGTGPTVIAEVYATADGLTRGALVGSIGSQVITSATPASYTFTPTSPVILNAGQMYWFQLRGPEAYPVHSALWTRNNPNVAPAGIFTFVRYQFSNNAGANWSTSPTPNLVEIDASPVVALAATAACNGLNLEVAITAGDGTFNITGTGPGLPLNAVAAGISVITGPGIWTGVTVTETTGDQEVANFGTIDCSTPLAATAVCNLDNLDVTITAGDGPFNITGTGPGLPLNGVAAGTSIITGPGAWTGVTVTEVGGNTQSTNLGAFNCATNGVVATAICQVENLVVTISAGDTPFNVTGTGPGLPLNGVAAGAYTLTGPGPWTAVTVTETTGNTQSVNLGNFDCTTNGVTTSAVCTGPNLVVTITAGDAPFNIVGTGPGLPLNGVAAGSYTLTGPATWTAVDVAETTGNLQVSTLGNFTCNAVVPPPPPVIPGIPVPNLGLILIDLGQAQFALQSPNGQPIALSDGTPVLLPADADHNGFDTYTVTGIVYSEGEYWLSIFLGNTTWGWVPLDDVTPLTPLELPDAVETETGDSSESH